MDRSRRWTEHNMSDPTMHFLHSFQWFPSKWPQQFAGHSRCCGALAVSKQRNRKMKAHARTASQRQIGADARRHKGSGQQLPGVTLPSAPHLFSPVWGGRWDWLASPWPPPAGSGASGTCHRPGSRTPAAGRTAGSPSCCASLIFIHRNKGGKTEEDVKHVEPLNRVRNVLQNRN